MSSSNHGSTTEIQEGLGSPQATVCLTGRLTKRLSLADCADNFLFEIASSWHILLEEAATERRSWRISIKVGHEAELVDKKEKSSVESAASNYSTGRALLDASVELSPGLDEPVLDLDLQGLCPATSHIFLKKGQIAKPLVQPLLKRHVCTLGLPWSDAVKHLDALLANLHSSSPLRNFFFFNDADDVKNNDEADEGDTRRILDAFKRTSFLPDGVIFYDVIPAHLVLASLPELCNLSTHLGIHTKRKSGREPEFTGAVGQGIE